jgi:cytochrome c oxidase assembly protein subunit 15
MPDPVEPIREDRERRYALRLARSYFALVSLTFCLIVLGALVRAHEAGLACPDWPLCFGEFSPQVDLQVGFEWSHRVFAATVSLGFLALGALALRRPATRPVAPWLALGLAVLAVQVLLGALTVWHLLAAWTVTAHLLSGNAFAAVLLLTGLALRDRALGSPPGPPARASARRWVALGASLLVVQIALGGLVSSRYAGLACPAWPACLEGVWFPSWEGAVGLHLLHRLTAYALVTVLLGAAVAGRSVERLRPLTALALGLGVAQLAVGVANVLLELRVEVTGLHTALAAALVLTVTLAMREVFHPRRPAPLGAGCY